MLTGEEKSNKKKKHFTSHIPTTNEIDEVLRQFLYYQETQAKAMTTTTTTSKSNWFYEQNNSSARASRIFLHFFDVHCRNTTEDLLMQRFYGERSLFLTWIKSLRIQLQVESPKFDKLSWSKKTQLSLKGRKSIF